MRVLTVLGTRPQIVKAGPLSRALAAAGHEEVLLLTGQHYDPGLAGNLAEEAGLPAPARSLGVGSASAAAQVAAVAEGVAAFARDCRPACVLASGDTNSALGAALGTRAAGIPFVHGEGGVRLGSFHLPEESNRVVADHLADLLLCPTERAAAAARAERPKGTVVAAGDPLLDALPAEGPGTVGAAAILTLHRAENTDDPARLRRIVGAVAGLPGPVLWPLHPRARKALQANGLWPVGGRVKTTDPLPHGALIAALRTAQVILTDSGSLQREAYWLGVPCVVLRPGSEWGETIDAGWAACVDADPGRIAAAAAAPPRGARPPDRGAFGGGTASLRWVRAIEDRFG